MQKALSTFKIGLGSMQQKKIAAILDVFPDCELITVNVKPPINQPFTRQDTLDMAKFRAKNVKFYHPDLHLYIGIQNGIWNEKSELASYEVTADLYKDKWDRACIYIINSKGNREVVIWTDMVPVCSFFDHGVNGEWSNMDDPHSVVSYSETNRTKLLSDAIKKYVAYEFLGNFTK